MENVSPSTQPNTSSSPSLSLADLRPGQRATVVRLDIDGADRWRLLDLGLVPGTQVTLERISPLGDPAAYHVRGAQISLRKAQAARIAVTNPEDSR